MAMCEKASVIVYMKVDMAHSFFRIMFYIVMFFEDTGCLLIRLLSNWEICSHNDDVRRAYEKTKKKLWNANVLSASW